MKRAEAPLRVVIVLLAFTLALMPSLGVIAFIPEPFELYGVARQETGVVLPDGSPIRTMVDGVDYSNKSSVFSRPGFSDGFFQVETYGNHKTNLTDPGTPWIKEGADDSEPIMYVWGDMSNNTQLDVTKPWLTGVVFKEMHNWITGPPARSGSLNAAPAIYQPPLIKIWGVVTNSSYSPYNDYVWLCNPTPYEVDLSEFYIQKDVLGSPDGPIHAIPATNVSAYSLHHVDLGTRDWFVESGDNVKLVWRNNASNPNAPYSGIDVIVDRVEFNASTGGTLYWEPGNTIQPDEVAPTFGFQINRTMECRDTNSKQKDFWLVPEGPPPPPNRAPFAPYPLTIDDASSAMEETKRYRFTKLTGYTLGWVHTDFERDQQLEADVAISRSPNRVNVTWMKNITGFWDNTTYDGPSLQVCTDYWYSARTNDGKWGQLGEMKFRTNCPPVGLSNQAPLNGSVLKFGTQMVWWNRATDGDATDTINYTWRVARDPAFTNVVMMGITKDNYSLPFATVPRTTYYWNVNASDGWMWTPWTAMWTFTTVPSDPPTLTLRKPFGGEDWSGGSTHEIAWVMWDDIDFQLNVWVNYSLNNGLDGYPYPIAEGQRIVGSNSILWSVPLVDSANVRIRITVKDSDYLTTVVHSQPFTIDSTPPEILATMPLSGFVGAKVTDDIQVVFNELVNRISAEQAFSISPDPGSITFSWTKTASGKDILIVKHKPFTPQTLYTVSFGTVLRDDSDPGNHPTAALTFTFSTKPKQNIQPPVAKAVGKNQVMEGELVTFDGSGSTGNITKYVWIITDNQGDIVDVLVDMVVRFTFTNHGRYTVTLRVIDELTGLQGEDSLEIVVTSSPKENVWMYLLIALCAAFIGGFFGGTEVGRVAVLMLLVAPAYRRRVRGREDPETRGMIRGYIRVHPGDTYTEIKNNLDLNNGCLSYHLRILEKQGKIKSMVMGTKRRYYPRGMPLPTEDGGELHEIERRMLHLIATEPGMSVRVLSEELGASRQLTLYHLRKLSQKGILMLERRGLYLKAFLESEKRD